MNNETIEESLAETPEPKKTSAKRGTAKKKLSAAEKQALAAQKAFIDALVALAQEKGIDVEYLYTAVEDAMKAAYKKNYGSDENVRVDINRSTGEIKVFAGLTVTDGPVSSLEISLEDARNINSFYNVGDVVEREITPDNFGRMAAQNAKQIIFQRVREAEQNTVNEYLNEKRNDVVTAVVQRFNGENVYVDLGKTEAVLMKTEQLPGEKLEPKMRIKVYIVEVHKGKLGLQVFVSRTHPGLLKRLFELEVPEIANKTVEIKSVAREAGFRSKVAVWSADPNVDPVGSCVGPRGQRVQTIVDELRGEKIDIVKYDENPAEYVANALSPSKVISANASVPEKICRVVVPDFQLSLAIGKEGQNARLAAKLTNWKIDIKSESQARAAAEQAGETVSPVAAEVPVETDVTSVKTESDVSAVEEKPQE